MQIKGKKNLQNIYLAEVVTEIVRKAGGKAAFVRALGHSDPAEVKKESVKLDHYMTTKSRPKAEFLNQVKQVFEVDILAEEAERKVSRGTKKEINITPVPKQPVQLKPSQDYDSLFKLSMGLMSDIRDLRDELKDIKERLKQKGI